MAHRVRSQESESRIQESFLEVTQISLELKWVTQQSGFRTFACSGFQNDRSLSLRHSRESGNPEISEHSVYLDSGSRPPSPDSSGMTGSASCDIVSKGAGFFAELNT